MSKAINRLNKILDAIEDTKVNQNMTKVSLEDLKS